MPELPAQFTPAHAFGVEVGQLQVWLVQLVTARREQEALMLVNMLPVVHDDEYTAFASACTTGSELLMYAIHFRDPVPLVVLRNCRLACHASVFTVLLLLEHRAAAVPSPPPPPVATPACTPPPVLTAAPSAPPAPVKLSRWCRIAGAHETYRVFLDSDLDTGSE